MFIRIQNNLSNRFSPDYMYINCGQLPTSIVASGGTVTMLMRRYTMLASWKLLLNCVISIFLTCDSYMYLLNHLLAER